jgi:hypothetical protein
MGIVDLPIVPQTLSLRNAFPTMREARRSAMVVRGANDYWLIKAAAVARALYERKTSLLEIPMPQKLIVPSMYHLAASGIDLKNLFSSENALMSLLDEAHENFALLSDVANQGLIVTRHEWLTMRIEPAPKTCYCMEPECDGSGNNTGDDCDINGHKGTVRCIGSF